MATIKKKVQAGSTRALSLAHFRSEVDIIKITDNQIKELTEANKKRREELKEFLKKEGRDHLMGDNYKAVLQPTSTTTMKSGKGLFTAIGLDRFLTVAKVSIEQARKNLTQQEFDAHFVKAEGEPTLKIL